MAQTSDIIARVRSFLGDRGVPFRSVEIGDGQTNQYQLAVSVVEPTAFLVEWFHNNVPTVLNSPTDYVLDPVNSLVTLTNPIPAGDTIFMSGQAYSLYSDTDLTVKINDALALHTAGRTVQSRYRDINGFIRYTDIPITLINLPPVEEQLVAMLATIECFWELASDAATDIDITSAEGTFLPRTQRYRNLVDEINRLKGVYDDTANQLGVGMDRIEMFTLRRVSRTTGRLVPVYKDREFDDYTPYPQRQLPPIDHRNDDTSGIPNQANSSGWW